MADIKTDSLSAVLEERVLKFIGRFTLNGKRQEVVECFSCGCCYWFAYILSKRFVDGYIVYDQVENHYAYYINKLKKVFDITGEVTEGYKWEKWDDVTSNDQLLATRLFRDCIAMEDMKND